MRGCVEDLALGYRLAAADYPAVSGVLLNESLALVIAHVSETDGLRSVGLEAVLLLGAHSFASISATYSAIAGAEERPGDSMPATLMNLSFFSLGSMMNRLCRSAL